MHTTATPYFIYLLRCSDGTFYTGIATDVAKRLEAHNSTKRGAKYTRTRRPVTLVYFELVFGRSAAQSREYALKQLSHAQKLMLAKSLK